MAVFVNRRARIEIVVRESHILAAEGAPSPSRETLDDLQLAGVDEGHMRPPMRGV
jgi:hypothetical protein